MRRARAARACRTSLRRLAGIRGANTRHVAHTVGDLDALGELGDVGDVAGDPRALLGLLLGLRDRRLFPEIVGVAESDRADRELVRARDVRRPVEPTRGLAVRSEELDLAVRVGRADHL